VILDLEDGVAPEDKVAAREAVARAVREGGFGDRELVVRVNGVGSEWIADDLAAVARARPDAVLIPKIASPFDLEAVQALDGVPMWLMIETCASILALGPLATASRVYGARAWVFGANDLALEMGARLTPGRPALTAALSLAVTAARVNGLAILDAVFNDIADAAGLAAECAQGRDLGFDGKTLIHPSQIAAANAAFSPGADEIAWAERVVSAFDSPENAGKGVLKVEGRMVERLHRDAARRVLAKAAAISTRDG
jgi:citrate lyase subunit beta/citryl-CoA lyase